MSFFPCLCVHYFLLLFLLEGLVFFCFFGCRHQALSWPSRWTTHGHGRELHKTIKYIDRSFWGVHCTRQGRENTMENAKMASEREKCQFCILVFCCVVFFFFFWAATFEYRNGDQTKMHSAHTINYKSIFRALTAFACVVCDSVCLSLIFAESWEFIFDSVRKIYWIERYILFSEKFWFFFFGFGLEIHHIFVRLTLRSFTWYWILFISQNP